MIPKIIHQIWIGTNQIPKEFLEFKTMWRAMYSDFEYLFWDDKLVETEKIVPNHLLKYYNDREYPLAFGADIVRYFILKKYGGLYVDFDTEPLKKIDDLVFMNKFFSAIQPNGEVAIGIIGSESNNELINKVCTGLEDNIINSLTNGYTKFDVYKLTGPQYFDSICKNFIEHEGYKFFESKFFYPYWFTEHERRFENFKKTCPCAYSVHHWAKSWWYVV